MQILLKVVSLPSGNQYLPFPLKLNEVVRYIGENPTVTGAELFDSQFVEIERLTVKQTPKRREVFYRNYFIDIKSKKPYFPPKKAA